MNIADYKGAKGLQDVTFTLAAGARYNFTGVGMMFQIAESDGTLTVKTDKGTEANFSQRQGIMADPTALFERIEIHNATGVAITARCLFGFGQFIDGTSAITGSVTVTSSALPAGASTAANQATEIASLASIDGKLPALGVVSTAAKQDAQTALLTTIDADTGAVAVSTASIDAKLTKAGAQDNAWAVAVVGALGTSAALDTANRSILSAFGNVDAATTITAQVSEDNVTYYDTPTNVVLGGASDFHITFTTAAKYVRLKSTLAATISATIVAKSQ